jgi:hypothetical protein
MADDPSLVLAVKTNLDGLKQGMKETEQIVQTAGQHIAEAGESGAAALDKTGTASRQAAGDTDLLAIATERLAAGFTAWKAIDILSDVIAYGDQIQNLHDKTGLTTDELQKLNVVTAQNNSSLTQASSAALHLAKVIAEGKDSTKGALQDLGLSYEQVRDMSMDEQFETVGRAIAGLNDKGEQASDAMKLMGRAGGELIPTFQNLGDQVGKLNTLNEEQIKLLSAMSSAWAGAKANAVPNMMAIIDAATGLSDKLHYLKEYKEWLDAIFGSIDQLPKVTGPAAAGVTKAFESMGPPIKTTTQALLDQQTAERALTKDHEQQMAALKAWAAATDDLDSVGKDFHATLASIDGETVEAIKFYLDAGVAQNTLATAYGLTASQIKAVAAARKEELDVAKAADEVHKLALKEQAEVQKQLTAQQQARTKEVNDAILAELKAGEAIAATTASTDKATQALATYTKAMDDLHRTKVEGVSQANQEQQITEAYTKALYDEAVAQDQANVAMAVVPKVAEPAKQSVQNLTGQINLGITSLQEYNKAIKDFYDSFGPSLVGTPAPMPLGGHRTPGISAEAAAPWPYIGPGHAAGGPVAAGVAYPVGEQGPEFFIPNQAGSVVPQGAAGVTVVQYITITQPLGSPRAIADAVGQATMASLQNRGERFRPAGV